MPASATANVAVPVYHLLLPLLPGLTLLIRPSSFGTRFESVASCQRMRLLRGAIEALRVAKQELNPQGVQRNGRGAWEH